MKNNVILIIVLFLFFVVLAVGAFFITREPAEAPVVGGDADEHGCIGSAGYTWCEAKDKCLREWEEPCEEGQMGGGMNKEVCEEDGGEWYETSGGVCEKNFLSEEECNTQGGVWDGCASACRHDPEAEICTEQCVLTCSFR